MPATDESFAIPAEELMARVRQIQLRMRRFVNDALSGAYRSTFRGSGIEFEEVRPYQPGDDVRSIDWNRTAHKGEAFVKTYVEERELTLQFVVDAGAGMDFGSRAYTKRELAAQVVALLSYVAVQAQDQVGLQLFAEAPGLHLPTRRGMAHAARAIREVLAARPVQAPARGPAQSALAAVLEEELRMLRRRALVFVISDFAARHDGAAASAEAARSAPAAGARARAAGVFEPAWREPLARLAQRHDVIAVRIVDPLEERLPEGGWIELEDPASGRRLDVDASSRAVRAAWSAAAEARRGALAQAFARARVDALELSTAGDIGEPIARYFERRRRGARAPRARGALA